MGNRWKDDYKRRENILYIVVWAILATIPVMIEISNIMRGTEMVFERVLNWWKDMIPMLAMFLINNELLMPKLLKKGHLRFYALSLIAIILVCFIYTLIQGPPEPPAGSPGLPPPPDRAPAKLPLHLLFSLLLGMITIGCNIAISLSYDYYRNKTINRELENYRLQQEIKYLKEQICPHFLMNVLNGIHEMAEEDVKKAQEMIIELSELLRHVLYEGASTSIASEVKFISNYVALMRMRCSEDVVSIKLNIPEKPSEIHHIAPLLFISFVENAFKHGISNKDKSHIEITLRQEEEQLCFSCTNTIAHAADSEHKSKEGGVGLSNIMRRLELLYGEEHSLCIIEDDKTYTVELTIPYR